MRQTVTSLNSVVDAEAPLVPAVHPRSVAVIGSGYVGLVAGACLAEAGHRVVCVDRDRVRIEGLKRGVMPIYEPGLDDLVIRNMGEGRLAFTDDVASAVAGAEIVFLAVGTPTRPRDGTADLSQLHAAARAIAPALDGPTVVVTKSTVPVGTGDEVERILREANPGAVVSVGSNPEFLREGSAISDFMRPDRIVIGVEDERAGAVLTSLYQPLDTRRGRLHVTDRRTAELIKYAANAFLAMKITFINEIADLSEKIGADVAEVARGIGSDRRIGPQFLNAGPGYGGSCFPKDTLALTRLAEAAGAPLRLVETTVAVNDARKRLMAGKIVAACGGTVRGRTVALLGLTFKPETDDMRESPALAVADALVDAGATVRAYDPHGMDQARSMLDGVAFCDGPYAAAEGADALALVTEWAEFAALDFARLGRIMRGRTVVDLRNFLDAGDAARHGFSVTGIGRPPVGPEAVLAGPEAVLAGPAALAVGE